MLRNNTANIQYVFRFRLEMFLIAVLLYNKVFRLWLEMLQNNITNIQYGLSFMILDVIEQYY
jgi:hypothetical protein